MSHSDHPEQPVTTAPANEPMPADLPTLADEADESETDDGDRYLPL